MDTNKPIGRIIGDVYTADEHYLKVEPLNTEGISVGSTLLYAHNLGPLSKETISNCCQQGFIFVNQLGHYATAPRMSFDHGPRREVITWGLIS